MVSVNVATCPENVTPAVVASVNPVAVNTSPSATVAVAVSVALAVPPFSEMVTLNVGDPWVA